MTRAPLRFLALSLAWALAACTSNGGDDGTIFDKYDGDRDGVITVDEWGGTAKAFRAWDLDNDGRITLAEFNTVIGVDAGTPDTGTTGMDAGVIMSKCEPLGPELPAGSAPIRRGDMAFAYDPNCERVIMFFGDKAEPQNCGFAASDFLPDGWMYDPARGMWSEIPPQSGPAPRERARSSGTWDPNSNRMIVFGGRWRAGTSGAYTFFNDLWAYDPTTNTWEELGNANTPNAPSGRMNTVLVADPERNRVLIHDGGTTDFTNYFVDEGVWAFNLGDKTWEKLVTTGPTPPARIFHTATLDRERDRFYVYGGSDPQTVFEGPFRGDTWFLDLNDLTWTRVTATPAPDGRIKGVIDYDAARDRIVLFAGHDNSDLGNNNDIWTLSLDALVWERAPGGDTFNRPPFGFCDFPANFAIIDPSFPERRESHLFSIMGNQALMFSGRTDCGLSNDTWMLDLRDLTWEELSQSFNGMTCYRSGRTDCDDPEARKCG